MKIAVIGPGAIGALVSGYLKLKNQEVVLIGKPESVKTINKNGLFISGVRGEFEIKINAATKLQSRPDLVILASKTQDVQETVRDNIGFIKGALVLTTQNGVRADSIVAEFVPGKDIISSIVMFGSTCLEPGVVTHNFEGSWLLGNAFGSNDKNAIETSKVLGEIFPAILVEDIFAMKYLKIFVNANNCIPAILGLSMQESFRDPDISRIAINIWKEGLSVINKAGIRLKSLPDFPLDRLIKLTSMPENEAAKIFSNIMVSLSKEPLYGSILQSLKRNRPSEIDYINGEFVKIAQENKFTAVLNEKLCMMVKTVEKTKKYFTKHELLEAVKQSIS